ncbi:catalase family peroxidase [Serratia rubidaea]|nr:catalase family peroxidase [Serratia rubidaea]
MYKLLCRMFTLLVMSAFPYSVSAQAITNTDIPTRSSSAQLVNALYAVFGRHPYARAVHAKGIVLRGNFTPSPDARTISSAPHLQKTTLPVPIIVRFSDFTGIPDISDTNPQSMPRGLAIKFQLQDGSTTDIVTHSFNGFPSQTTDDFRDLLIAMSKSGPTVPKPTPLDHYLDTHPKAKSFLTAPKPFPVSYATLPYYGVNAFKFTNRKGDIKYGRYQLLPEAGEQSFTDEEAAKQDPNYLQTEIRNRVKKHNPIKFRLMVQLAQPGDPLHDPSSVWPNSRKTIELGELTITQVVANSDLVERKLLFLPGAVTKGIQPEDPMITARTRAYPVSYQNRQK